MKLENQNDPEHTQKVNTEHQIDCRMKENKMNVSVFFVFDKYGECYFIQRYKKNTYYH